MCALRSLTLGSCNRVRYSAARRTIGRVVGDHITSRIIAEGEEAVTQNWRGGSNVLADPVIRGGVKGDCRREHGARIDRPSIEFEDAFRSLSSTAVRALESVFEKQRYCRH